MTTMANTIGDSVTMLRRNLVRMMRYPVAAAAVIALPVVFLLLFVVVLGETLGAGLGAAAPSGAYIDYVVPGILLMAIAGGAQGTAISVAMDMNEGTSATAPLWSGLTRWQEEHQRSAMARPVSA